MRMVRRLAGVVLLLAGAVGLSAGEVTFKKQHIDKAFRSEGVAVGDVNRDGKVDILAGALWYEAPDWKPHEVYPARTWKPQGEYSDSFICDVSDVNQDGWVDYLVIDQPGVPCHWFENPKNKQGHWKKHVLYDDSCNESPWFIDLAGDKRLEVVMAIQPEAQMCWFEPRADGPWTIHPISPKKAPGTHKYAHGLGVCDMNKDGRKDVIVTKGWWEAPSDPTSPDWKFHPAELGPDCVHMLAYDVDGDGDMDVLSSSAHKYGLWWHEQAKDASGKVTWKRHDIYTKLSQLHALILADMNADGLPDLVTGKRYFAHHGRDPGGHEPALLYWFEFSRKEGKPSWTPHLIDNDSGVGTQFIVQDINGDKKLDIAISNKKGTFYFEQVGN